MDAKLTSKENVINALRVCESNYDGTGCNTCPIKDDDYGAWYDNDGNCFVQLHLRAAELLENCK